MKRFILINNLVRRRAVDFIMNEATEGFEVTVKERTKKRAQEEKYHAQIGDIADQTTYINRRWAKDDMKRILVAEFAEEMRKADTPLHTDGDDRMIPSADGRRVIQLGIQTRDFWVSEASNFIEWLYAYGAERDVVWSDEAVYA